VAGLPSGFSLAGLTQTPGLIRLEAVAGWGFTAVARVFSQALLKLLEPATEFSDAVQKLLHQGNHRLRALVIYRLDFLMGQHNSMLSITLVSGYIVNTRLRSY